jgi:hydrogenase nickel incorporation protein HypA/HybF
MHELSIARRIVCIAEAHAEGRRVTAVEVQVGALRQVVPSALDFAFELVAAGTNVAGAELEVEQVMPRIRCARCRFETDVSGFPLACLRCGGLDVDIVAGDELLVASVELEEEPMLIGGE